MIVRSHAILAGGWIAIIVSPVSNAQSHSANESGESSPNAVEAERTHERSTTQPAAAQPLKTTSPEADDWPLDPWPSVSDAEQLQALHAVRAGAQRRADAVGFGHDLTPLETARFIMHTDMPRPEAARLILMLEKACDALERMLPTPSPEKAVRPHFFGKCVVMLFAEQDAFRQAEADVFNQLVPLNLLGICHPVGEQAYVVAHRGVDDALLEWTLVHETVHAWMHRWRSPKRLPAWANEGLAEHVADQVLKGSRIGRERRQHALDFIRASGDLKRVLDLTYADAEWPGPREIGPSLGALVVELTIREHPRAFARWAAAVKGGKDWRDALRRELGVTPERLAHTAAQFYIVNN